MWHVSCRCYQTATDGLPAGGLTLERARRHTPRTVSSTWTARVSATVAALAVALVGLLPEGHIHTRGDRTQVHRHLIDPAPTHHHGGAIAHEGHHDHADARLLGHSFDSASRGFSIVSLAATPWFLMNSETDHARPTSGKTLLPTHDPPVRFTSSPAPPAVL